VAGAQATHLSPCIRAYTLRHSVQQMQQGQEVGLGAVLLCTLT